MQPETFTGWVMARPGADRPAEQVGREATQFIPAGPKGKVLRIEGGRCQADVEYASAWQTEGVDADGVPFKGGSGRNLYWVAGLC